MSVEKEIIAGRLFMEAALVDLPLICQLYSEFGEKFSKRTFSFQVKIIDNDYKAFVGFRVDKGVFSQANEIIIDADIEFTFNSLLSFNTYFAGKGAILPKIKGMLKIALFMDVISLLSKYSSILWQKQPLLEIKDREVQSILLSRILSRSINIILSEELVDITHYFGAEQNIVIHQLISDFDYILPDIVLKYAPNENTCLPELVEFNLDYINYDNAINAILGNGQLSQSESISSQSKCIRVVEYFAMKASEYTQLLFR